MQSQVLQNNLGRPHSPEVLAGFGGTDEPGRVKPQAGQACGRGWAERGQDSDPATSDGVQGGVGLPQSPQVRCPQKVEGITEPTFSSSNQTFTRQTFLRTWGGHKAGAQIRPARPQASMSGAGGESRARLAGFPLAPGKGFPAPFPAPALCSSLISPTPVTSNQGHRQSELSDGPPWFGSLTPQIWAPSWKPKPAPTLRHSSY